MVLSLPRPYPTHRTLKLGFKISANSIMTEPRSLKAPKVLCLHGFRTSAQILKTQMRKWPQTVMDKFDFDFLDGQFPAQGKSLVDGIFDPPYYEWFQISKNFSEYMNIEECMVYIENYMIKNGPFDGLLGFSQGAIITAAVPGMQAQGVAFTKVPKVKFVIIISGAKLRAKFRGIMFGQREFAACAYSSPIHCPSLHFLGERDFLRTEGATLLNSFVDPVVIHHPQGHTIPRLNENSQQIIHNFIQNV